MSHLINTDWHRHHPAPKTRRWEPRMRWHLAHQAHCACRPIPASLLSKPPLKREADPPPVAERAPER